MVLCIDLPWAIGEGLGIAEDTIQSLGAITSLLYAGIDLLDDLADGDQPTRWSDVAPAQLQLAATTLIAALPQLAIAQLPLPVAQRAAMHHTIATGLLHMSAGQQQDLAMHGTAVTAHDVEAAVVAKSGAEGAMFATLAALAFGVAPDRVPDFASVGQQLATAGQLASDCYDLFQTQSSRDLTNGTHTWPIAAYLDHLAEDERRGFIALLTRARHELATQTIIRQQLHAWAAVRRCALLVELYCQRARQRLAALRPLLHAPEPLHRLIDQVSFFATNNPTKGAVYGSEGDGDLN